MKLTLAGHEFADKNIDSVCIRPKSDGSKCNATRLFCFEATADDVGKVGYAHTLALNNAEYNDIVNQREDYKKYCESVMEALHSVCAG